MKKVLFFDDDLIIPFNYNKKIIIDYFDIESQKILPIIKFSFKSNPQILYYKNILLDTSLHFDYLCNIRNPKIIKRLSLINIEFGVVFDCYF